MKIIRTVIIVLAVLHLVFTAFTGMVAFFADGGTLWQRILISGLHPVAAIALLAVLSRPQRPYGWPMWAALALPAASIVGDLAMFVSVSSGATKGDASLALAFAAIPLLGFIYAIIRGMGPDRTPSSGPGEPMYGEQATDPVVTAWFRDVMRHRH